MRLKALALAAWSSGNCPVGSFCVWPEYWYGDTDMTPSLATETEWSGSAAGHIFYNNTSQDMTMTYAITADADQGEPRTSCVSAVSGSYFTMPMTVTKLTVREDDGTPCY